MTRPPLHHIFLLSLLASASLAQEWRCVNPDAPESDDGMVNRGSRTTVCLTVGPGSDWAEGVSYSRYVFRPTADEYSVYRVSNSYRDLVQLGELDYALPNISVFAASGASLSFLRRYYEQNQGLIYPFLTAIVNVKDGVVNGIAFDDSCGFCPPDACLENTYGFDGLPATVEPSRGCSMTKTTCDEIHGAGGNQCDLQLYVVWTGTDEDGNVLNSADSRFSLFEPRALQDRFLGLLPEMPNWGEMGNSIGDFFTNLNPFGGNGGG